MDRSTIRWSNDATCGPEGPSLPEPKMSLPRTVAEVLKQHVTLEVEGIDRMYLNVYVPQIQCDRGVVGFFCHHRGNKFASMALMSPMTLAFVKQIEQFAQHHRLDLILFDKSQRKDDVTAKYLADFDRDEGVLAGLRPNPTSCKFTVITAEPRDYRQQS